MTQDQIIILIILVGALVMFIWERWRHDMVALGALLACVVTGLLPGARAFEGFGHPAVITVACVLVLSRGLQLTGAVEVISHRILPSNAGPVVSIAALTGIGAFFSAFMNNVGALALLMPIAIHLAEKRDIPPGQVLMPLAFGTVLGGMTTLIGTPPNLIVSGFRADEVGQSFSMFDFSPVGVAVASTGVVFIALVGWRLVPRRQKADIDKFDTGTYLTEVRVPEKAKAENKTLDEIEDLLYDADAQVVGLVRNEYRVTAPSNYHRLRAGDVLVIEADPESLSSALSDTGLELEQALRAEEEEAEEKAEEEEQKIPRTAPKSSKEAAEEHEESDEAKGSADVILQELVAMPGSNLLGNSASDIQLRARYNINLLAISRQGRRSIKRLRSTSIKNGDVILLQGSPEAISAFAREFDCVPLAERAVGIPHKRKAALALIIMVAAIALSALGILPVAVSFAGGMLAYMALRILPLRSVYTSIDWPVIVLLGALMPVAGVLSDTGAADLLAEGMLNFLAQGSAVAAVVVILVLSILLSSVMNNAATAAVMCQIAISSGQQLNVNVDTFLMAVAVGASCSFLTPIGHQNNTLILGPGGFRFGDYWRLGLPLEMIVVLLGTPMLLWIWPL